jgi:hypothetical protein
LSAPPLGAIIDPNPSMPVSRQTPLQCAEILRAADLLEFGDDDHAARAAFSCVVIDTARLSENGYARGSGQEEATANPLRKTEYVLYLSHSRSLIFAFGGPVALLEETNRKSA